MLLCFWDNGFVAKKRPRNKEHPVDAATQPPRSDPNHFRRPPLGGQCRAAPSGHPGAAPRPARTRPASPRPRRCPGAGEHERQDDDAGSVCVDDADVLRTGGTACTLGGTVKAPSTLGTFLRSFRWGHVRQLDRVSRELLARAWQAGAGPGDGPLTIDLDSTICETYGLAKEGARHYGYTGKRGYHLLLAIAAGTGDVLMSRLREGRANTARGAAHFLRETVGTGALRRGQRTTHATGRQRVLHSWRGIRLPQDGCPLLHHHPPAQKPAQSHRGDTRRCLDADSLLDGRCRRCGRDHLHPFPGRGGRRAGTGSSSGG